MDRPAPAVLFELCPVGAPIGPVSAPGQAPGAGLDPRLKHARLQPARCLNQSLKRRIELELLPEQGFGAGKKRFLPAAGGKENRLAGGGWRIDLENGIAILDSLLEPGKQWLQAIGEGFGPADRQCRKLLGLRLCLRIVVADDLDHRGRPALSDGRRNMGGGAMFQVAAIFGFFRIPILRQKLGD